MTRPNNHLLLIDDDPKHAQAFREALIASRDDPRVLEWFSTLSSGLERLAHKHQAVRAIFLNLNLPDSRGLETLDRLLQVTPVAPIIVLGGVDDEAICKQAMLSGAQD
jgi:DNA-binding NarL/FixJ family response regulator